MASRAKTLKTDKTTIHWYSQNESLTIGGTDAEKIKGSLESRAMVIYSGENRFHYKVKNILIATKTKLRS